MDTYLHAAKSHYKLAHQVLQVRLDRLENSTTRLSRHYNKIQHTRAMLGLTEELLGLVSQDPDNWDEEPDLVPF